MRLIFAFVISLFVLPSFAATCYKQALFYGCSNSSGTTCTKVTVTALIPDGATALGSCPYLTITGAEYTQWVSDSTNQAALNTNINNVQIQANNIQNNLNTTNSNLSALQTTVNNWNSSLTGWDSKIAANTQAVGTINTILNEPFDLATGMAGFAFFFSTTLFFYGVSRGAGAILETIRRPVGRV